MKKQTTATIILFAAMMIIMLGFSIAIPLMPFYVTHFGASASALGFMMAMYSIMQFLFAPMWGRLSDRYGRKPVILIGIAGNFITFLMQGFAQSIVMLTLTRTLAGVITSATLPTAMAYMADITRDEDRSRGVGLMGAAMGMGMIFGPSLGGLITGLTLPLPPFINNLMQITTDPNTGGLINLSFPFFVSALLALLAFPFILFLLPETLTPEKRQVIASVARQSQVKQITAALRGPSGFLFLLAFLLAFALANVQAILGMYGKDIFLMGPSEIGLMMGVIGILVVIQQGIVIGPLTRKVGEVKVIWGGLVISTIGFVLMAVVNTKVIFFIAVIIFHFGSVLLQPSVTALISKRARTGQGEAMGLNNSFQAIGRSIGPLWAGYAYDIYSKLSFFSGAFIQIVAFIYSIKMLRGMENEPAKAVKASNAVSFDD